MKGAVISRHQATQHVVNAAITAPAVLLIDADGTNLGTMPTPVALARAAEADLDLVLLSPDASPPVARVMDYSHYVYLQKKKARDSRRASRAAETHQMKMRPMVADHDYRTKLQAIRRFLQAHDRVKVTVVMQGRMITHPELAVRLLERVIADTSDLAAGSATPDLRGRDMSILLTPSSHP